MASNLHELADIAVTLHDLDVDVWEVFFLITMGRGTEVLESTALENEDVCNFLVDASRYGFTVRTVEAPFFRRVAAARKQDPQPVDAAIPGPLYHELRDRLFEKLGAPTAPVRAPSAATRDGKGIIFIATNGDIYPSGFMPYRLGNVREEHLIDVYRDNTVLRAIRAATFEEPCGSCEYAQLCGGSRARATRPRGTRWAPIQGVSSSPHTGTTEVRPRPAGQAARFLRRRRRNCWSGSEFQPLTQLWTPRSVHSPLAAIHVRRRDLAIVN